MVGKILDKRYVVLEEVGADGAGFRYLVYDMNTLRRLHLRVDPDGNGQLSGNTYAVVDMDAPLAPAKQAAPAAGEVSVPAARPRRPTPKGFAPTAKPAEEPEEKPAKAVVQTVPDDGDKDSVPIPRLDALPSKTAPPQEPALLRKPKATPVPPGLEEKPLEQALERALTDAKPAAEPEPPPAEETKDPFNTTQPIDLASAEEIAQEAQAQQPAPQQDQRQSGERPRIQTKVLEAAWFAQGDQLEEEEEHVEETAERPVDHDQLERQAAELSPDEYRKYALDLPPPMPPPVRIVEAFLGAKPDVVARLVDQQQDPAPSSPPEPAKVEPPQGASPFQIAPPPKVEATPPPKVEATPPPKVELAPPPKVELPPPKVEPVPPPKVEPVPPPKVEPVPPPKVEAAPPPKVELPPPPKAELAPPPKAELAPPPPEVPPPAEPAPAPAVIPPVDQLLPPEPGLPAPQPEPFKPPEPLPPTRSTPTFPPAQATALRGRSARLPAEQLRPKALGTRAGTFLLGLLLGGLVAGGLTCLLTPDAKAPAPPAKVAPAPAPRPITCPKPPPCRCKVATPAPAPAKPAPAEEQGLSVKNKRQLHKYLRLANRAMKRHQWRRARNLASLALKLDPKEPRAQRIKHRAERRLGR